MQYKPFEYGDCGKKFSRSDNLAQHARTAPAPSSFNVIDDADAIATPAVRGAGVPWGNSPLRTRFIMP